MTELDFGLGGRRCSAIFIHFNELIGSYVTRSGLLTGGGRVCEGGHIEANGSNGIIISRNDAVHSIRVLLVSIPITGMPSLLAADGDPLVLYVNDEERVRLAAMSLMPPMERSSFSISRCA